MALTTKQRNALPRSAFAYAPKGKPRSAWKYPVPTKTQAQKAGISEAQRLATHRNALSRSAQRTTAGTPARVRPIVYRRTPGSLGKGTGRGRGR